MPEPTVCPECVAGKHQNCDTTAWDVENDRPAKCECNLEYHPEVDRG